MWITEKGMGALLSLAPGHPQVSGPASVHRRSAWGISLSCLPDSDVVVYSQPI